VTGIERKKLETENTQSGDRAQVDGGRGLRDRELVRAGLTTVVALIFAVAACGAGQAIPPTNPGQPQCRMGTDGVQACGYTCMMGTDGHMACANSLEGVCAMGNDGHVTCSEVAGGGAAAVPPPTCKTSASGSRACGYNCQFGANGNVYCASRPDGRCAMNADGSYSCP
jgi:hypothetical protein